MDSGLLFYTEELPFYNPYNYVSTLGDKIRTRELGPPLNKSAGPLLSIHTSSVMQSSSHPVTQFLM